MPFTKMTLPKYPHRRWGLIGFPESGKSTFATQMRSPLLVVDADHRFAEVLALVPACLPAVAQAGAGRPGDVLSLSQHPADNVVPDTIARLLLANMPGSGVATIVVDSLTAIIAPLITQAMVDNQAGRNKNRVAAFTDKALAMRQLQDAVTRWGCDVLWIYHLQQARNEKAENVVRATLPATEQQRLRRSLNAELHIVLGEDGRRGIRIAWARQGHVDRGTLWDESGHWAAMPERIEAALYDSKGADEQSTTALPDPQAPTLRTIHSQSLAEIGGQGRLSASTQAGKAPDPVSSRHPVTTGNGNSTRPLAPDTLREHLLHKASAYDGKQASVRQVGLAASMLQLCFAGEDGAEAKRKRATLYLFGFESMKEATGAQVLALLDWLKPAQDSGGQWLPDAMAAREAKAVVEDKSVSAEFSQSSEG